MTPTEEKNCLFVLVVSCSSLWSCYLPNVDHLGLVVWLFSLVLLTSQCTNNPCLIFFCFVQVFFVCIFNLNLDTSGGRMYNFTTLNKNWLCKKNPKNNKINKNANWSDKIEDNSTKCLRLLKEKAINKGSGPQEFQGEVGRQGSNSSRVGVTQHCQKESRCEISTVLQSKNLWWHHVCWNR